jgi:hypothetical protein
MPVAAGSIFNHLMEAVVALLDVRAKGGCAACDDVLECLPLLGRQNVSPAIEEFLTVLAEDIGDFQPGFR